MKKKIFITLGVVTLVLFGSIIAIPYFFKDEIKQEALKYINNNFEGEVKIEDYNLSLISSFPRFNFSFLGIEVIDDNDKELFSMNDFSLEINAKDLILNNKITIESIKLVDASINYSLAELEDSNDDVEKKETPIPEKESIENAEKSSEEKEMSFHLTKYSIINASVIITDEKGKDFLNINNLNHSGYGSFENDILSISTKTSIEKINIFQGNVNMLKDAKIQGDFNVELDMKKNIYTLRNNNIKVNNIELNWVGVVREIESGYDIDLKFDTPKTKFKDLLALVTEDYKDDLKDIDAKGKFNIQGSVAGIYNEKTMPSFGMNIAVDNAFIKYVDLDESVDDINFLLKINKPQGNDLDKLVINMPKFSLKIVDNKIEADFSAKKLMSDPNISANIKANIDFSKIKKAIPIEQGDDISGKISANISMKGKLSDLENENYDKFVAKGNVELKKFNFSTTMLKDEVKIKHANINVTPQTLYLNEFIFSLGNSDVSAKGKINKYIEYALKDEKLEGWLDIKSNNFFATDFMPLDDDSTTEAKTKSDDSSEASSTKTNNNANNNSERIEIPSNIDFNTNISIKQLAYDNINIRNIIGSVGIKNQIAYLKNMNMYIFAGKMSMDGNYSSKNKKNAKVDFAIILKNIDIAKVTKTFVFTKKIAPAIENAKGKIDSKFNIKTTLDNNMDPIYNTMYSSGGIKLSNLELKSIDFLEEIGDALNIDEFKKNHKIANVNLTYTIKKGILNVSPFKIKIGDIESEIFGSSNIGKETVDMDIKNKIPRKYIGDDVNKAVDDAVFWANKFGLKIDVGSTIDVNVNASGNINSPKYSLSYGKNKNKSINMLMNNMAKDIIETTKKEQSKKIKKEGEKQSEKIKKDLEKKAKELLNDFFK